MDKRKKVTAKKYNEIINKLLDNYKNSPVYDILILALEEADKYEIIDERRIR
jgi:hypothetical protein